jgi:pimeloyl-ACP methyl ester carboxylesterase
LAIALLLASAIASGAMAQQDPSDALANQIVTATLAGRSISGLVTHQPGATQFKRGIALFPGHPGIMRLRTEDNRIRYELRANFLVRSRGYWLDDETLTVTIDAPDDQWGSFTQRFRATPRYGEDVAGMLAAVGARYGRLEWTFVGTSEGSISAFHAARMLPGQAARVILTSSVFLPGRNGRGLADADWAALRTPLHWVHHFDDPCTWTRYADAEKHARLTGAPLVTVRGGAPWRGDACMAFTAHGFAGIERKVVAAMREWVRSGKAPETIGD